MSGFELILTNARVTQPTRLDEFDDLDINSLVTQCETITGVRNAQNNFAPGFASAAVENDHLIVVELDSAYYIVGGSSQNAESELSISPGERIIYSTDEDGNIKSTIRLTPDDKIRLENENGYIELKDNGSVDVNGHLTVAKASP